MPGSSDPLHRAVQPPEPRHPTIGFGGHYPLKRPILLVALGLQFAEALFALLQSCAKLVKLSGQPFVCPTTLFGCLLQLQELF